MTKERNKIQLFSYGVTLLVSLIILGDFILPGSIYTDEVIAIKKERQQYYNAAGNYHYSYKAVTSQHRFLVSEDFAKSAQDKKIKYSVSLLFKEINRYGLLSSKESMVHSLRIASGLILPLLIIGTILIAYKYKKRIGTLLFILQIILLGNLVLLIG